MTTPEHNNIEIGEDGEIIFSSDASINSSIIASQEQRLEPTQSEYQKLMLVRIVQLEEINHKLFQDRLFMVLEGESKRKMLISKDYIIDSRQEKALFLAIDQTGYYNLVREPMGETNKFRSISAPNLKKFFFLPSSSTNLWRITYDVLQPPTLIHYNDPSFSDFVIDSFVRVDRDLALDQLDILTGMALTDQQQDIRNNKELIFSLSNDIETLQQQISDYKEMDFPLKLSIIDKIKQQLLTKRKKK